MIIPNVFCGVLYLAMSQRIVAITITVVSQRAHHADDETPGASGLRASASSIVMVLPENSGVFFVDTNHILDYNRLSTVADICSRLSSDQKLSPSFKSWEKQRTK